MAQYNKICRICGKKFIGKRINEIYCSDDCRYIATKESVKRSIKKCREKKKLEKKSNPLKCVICGEPIITTARKYCSHKCYKKGQSELFKLNGYSGKSFSALADEDYFESESERKKSRKKCKSLSEICAEAKEHGMDYGEYVTWMERNRA